jgi:tRNA pseudouridine55 synthase
MTTSPKAEISGLLLVDKSLGPTSHDVVAVARRALGTRAVGHTGTLDPTASGALVLVIGEATKLVNMLSGGEKRYHATLQLGAETTTLDAGGEVVATAAVPALTRADVEQAARAFAGEIEQRAPLVSAIKIEGRSLQKRVRAGETVEAPLRRVRIDALEIEAFDGQRVVFSVRCGKGFYVRALARDLAAALGTLGHLTALRRTHNAGFSVDDAVTFESLRAAARGTDQDRENVRARLLPLVSLCQRLPHASFDDDACTSLRHGRALSVTDWAHLGLEEQAELIAFSSAGQPVAIVQRSLDTLRVLRGFRVS